MTTLLAPEPSGPIVPLDRPPSFSVIIAAYQAAPYAAAAVTSALEQTYRPSEVIVVDDGSTDGLADVLEPFRREICLIAQENRGESAARNVAVGAATGDYVVILDADDTWQRERLERLAEAAMARPDVTILTTDAWIEEDGEVVGRYSRDSIPFEVADQRAAILWSDFVFIHAAVPRQAWMRVGGMAEVRVVGVDWDLWRRLILTGGVAGMVDEPLAHYRRRPGSLTDSRPRVLRDRILTLEMALAHPSLTRAERRMVRSRISAERIRLARECLAAGVPGTRRQLLDVMVDPHFVADVGNRMMPPSPRARVTASAWAASALVSPRRARRGLRPMSED